MCPTRMLRWSVEIDVCDIHSLSYRHAEGLNGAVQIHVKESVLIVPDTGGRSRDLITYEVNAIVAVIGLRLSYRRLRPGLNRRLHARCVSRRYKGESVRTAADRKRTIGEIVEHVALVGMRLAPGEFMRGDVSGFAEIFDS